MNRMYVLLSKNNCYVGIVSENEFEKILEEICFVAYEEKENVRVFKSDSYNSTYLKKKIAKIITK